MESTIICNARALLQRWLPAAKQHLYTAADQPEMTCYGTGESYHWAIQTNGNAFAALASLAVSPNLNEQDIGMSREELRELALRLLRFNLHTHKCADKLCTNGQQWGKSWISGLSLERTRHGVDALLEYLTEEDSLALRRVMIAESDNLLDDYPIHAGYDFYENRPESNLWNGSLLLRTALDYPDAPRRDEYLEKATRFFVNGISIPADAESTQVYNGKTVKEMFVGANFTENYSLNHNGFQNMGYAALAISNIGFLHFSAKKHGWKLPPEVYSHVADLWNVLKHFFFEDGRFIRIGGDNRVRYCYCQDYAVPAWLFIWDLLGDPLALQFEQRWQKLIDFEARQNPDGSFLSARLQKMALDSPFYYTRLEGDRAVSTSYSLFWREAGLLRSPEPQLPEKPAPDIFSWQDERHAATFDKNPRRICSLTFDSAARPVALCLPAHRSDMAEWLTNLSGELLTSSVAESAMYKDQHQLLPGGFVNSGAVLWTEKTPHGEGELEAVYARHALAMAALPDGASAIILQHAVTTRRVYLRRVKGMGCKMPNDLYNGKTRLYASAEGELRLSGYPGREETIRLKSSWLNVDGCLSFLRAYGGDGMVIYRPADQQIRVLDYPHTSLYADELCTQFEDVNAFFPCGSVVLDTGFAVTVGLSAEQTAQSAGNIQQLALGEQLRGVALRGIDGIRYALVANFSKTEQAIPAPYRDLAPLNRTEAQAVLAPLAACLYTLG